MLSSDTSCISPTPAQLASTACCLLLLLSPGPPCAHSRRPPPPLQVLSEDGASNVRWLRLDASLLKQQLVTLCDNWVSAFQGLLASQASRHLAGLTEELTTHVAQLTGRTPHRQLDQAAPGEAGQEQQHGAEAAGSSGGGGAEPESAGEGEAQAPVPAQPLRTPRQAVAELEALHGRLQAQREELEERIAACRDKYEALVQLQVGRLAGELEGMDLLHCEAAQGRRLDVHTGAIPAATSTGLYTRNVLNQIPHHATLTLFSPSAPPSQQVGIPDEELAGVDALPGLWGDFVAALDGVPARLRQLWEA